MVTRKTPTRRPRQRPKPDVAEMLGAMSPNGNGQADVSRETLETAREGAGDDVGSAGPAAASARPARMVRPDPRGAMRTKEAPHELTSRERAEVRAAEIFGHLEGALDEGPDELALDAITVPDGWTYEWKRKSVYGKEEPSYDSRLARTGWETVPASRHPAMMPKGHKGDITRDGLVLMERPEAITKRVQQIMYKRARDAVRNKERSLNDAPQGTFERVDEGGRPTARVRTSYSPVTIPVPDA